MAMPIALAAGTPCGNVVARSNALPRPHESYVRLTNFSSSPARSTSRLARRGASTRASIGEGVPRALTPELKEALDKFVAANKVVLFMKGTKLFPQCGFSNTCVQILNLMGMPYETVNILEDEQLRQAMKEYSAWPTFPQLYIDGEFFGGCDITVEAFQSGELKELLERVALS